MVSRTISSIRMLNISISEPVQRTLGYMAFALLFLVEVSLAALRYENIAHLEAVILVALGFASFRSGRALSYNAVFSWLRAPFTMIVADSSGAGDSVEPKGTGLIYVIGHLLCCPICTSTQSAITLLLLLAWVPPVGTIAVYALAAAGLAEYLHWSSERAEWEGRAARERAGTEYIRKTGGRDG